MVDVGMSEPYIIVTGDNIETLRLLDSNSVHAVVTDPPYGLSEAPDMREVLACWLADKEYVHGKAGFMGRTWDSLAPSPMLWCEVLRVLKPGGFCFVFAAARTVDIMGLSLRLAGFEIRGSISWVQSKGLPKGQDTSKRIDKELGDEREVVGRDDNRARPNRTKYSQGTIGALANEKPTSDRSDNGATITVPGSDLSAPWEDFGDDLSPSHEPIIKARKPLEGTIARNVLTHGTGVLNVGACRTRTVPGDEASTHAQSAEGAKSAGVYGDYAGIETQQSKGQKKGRYPKDFVLVHAPECVSIGTRKVRAIGGGFKPGVTGTYGAKSGIYGAASGDYQFHTQQDQDGNETVPLYACVPWCAIRGIADVNGVKKFGTGAVKTRRKENNCGADDTLIGKKMTEYGDEGTVDRFFPTFDWTADVDDLPMFYAPKVGPKERDEGLTPVPGEHRANNHVTVKPISFMRWLCRLACPPGGTVLDPFVGSGSTGCAAVLEGFDFIGMELDPIHAAVAEDRVAYWLSKRGDK